MKPQDNMSRQLRIDIPLALYDELRIAAEKRGINIYDLLRQFIKLGMLAIAVEETDESALMIKSGDDLRELLLVD